ncbi:GNAT family N-acetyltransferase [Undibacterium cyanobacteriorum]|uniref:GNAT family N-acetyltransferase n=1 Tax=Undibacterium cyanobacteriorum TaxID=3073561 RepID=A0ABY9RIW1_9BURK|nr:GNAT family N-acetyltransferase [Undibacterium sp. 20NA77.5]WMW80619.1 GNAT family N-acetyltransferase [Undibacterium sp. 20NA77.5]
MLTFKRCDSNDSDFQALVRELDRYLALIDGEEHAFYAQYNKTDSIKHVVLAYLDGRAVACGAFKPYGEKGVEIKRMYAAPDLRGQGLASKILQELENWAASLGYQLCVLETGKRQADAVRLYEKNGYHVIPNYGQYVEAHNSVCYEKRIGSDSVEHANVNAGDIQDLTPA